MTIHIHSGDHSFTYILAHICTSCTCPDYIPSDTCDWCLTWHFQRLASHSPTLNLISLSIMGVGKATQTIQNLSEAVVWIKQKPRQLCAHRQSCYQLVPWLALLGNHHLGFVTKTTFYLRNGMFSDFTRAPYGLVAALLQACSGVRQLYSLPSVKICAKLFIFMCQGFLSLHL